MLSAILGIAVSFYLLIQHTRLKSGIQDSASFCSFGRFADCDVVNASSYSEFLGIPLAAFGACFYFLLLLMMLIAPQGDSNFRRVQRGIAWLTSFGLLVDVALFLVQLIGLHTFCIMCLITYLATFGILGGAWLLAKAEEKSFRFNQLFFADREEKADKFSSNLLILGIIGAIAFGAVVTLVPSFIRVNSQMYSMIDNALEQFYSKWKDLPQKTIEIQDGDGTLGDPSAKVRIVEFSDFECPFCQRTAFTIHTALRSLENRVSFVYKYFPLDSACNPAVMYQLHPQACALARLGYCAQKKGKFWAYHDLVFLQLSEEQLKQGIDAISSSLQSIFTRDEINQCLTDANSLKGVTEDIKTGNGLGVKGTPTLYINGKQVMNIPVTVETLNKLVSIEESLH